MNRYSTSDDIKSYSKRVTAKVRAITKEIKSASQASSQRRASLSSN
jgi:hypothetical protein